MTDADHILLIAAEHNRPVGWYPIAQMLSMRGIVLQQSLSAIIDSLVERGELRKTIDLATLRPRFVVSESGNERLALFEKRSSNPEETLDD